MADEWYRTPGYDDAAREEFARRYQRARHPGRIQYKRIKAVHLMEAGAPGGIAWAQELLEEVATDNEASSFDKKVAFDKLAELRVAHGDWQLAVQALEQGIAMGGMSAEPHLMLAETLLDHAPGRLAEVAGILGSVAQDRRLVFRSQAFRYYVASARLARKLGHDPGPAASAALDLIAADRDGPQLPRHPDVGRIQTSEQTIRELREMADGPTTP